ncbi:universal stress protein [Herbaspirillum sp. HC18]|nr:universal stress protein [Herbaspirillum sp. HC18]
MLKILLAIDGSESASHAADHVIRRALAMKDVYEVHLINVQYPLHGSVSSFIDQAQIKQYHHDEGVQAVTPVREKFDAAGIPCQAHLLVGEPAQAITRYAREHGFDEIVVGSRGLSGISSLLVGSIATKIIHLAQVPVLLVK